MASASALGLCRVCEQLLFTHKSAEDIFENSLLASDSNNINGNKEDMNTIHIHSETIATATASPCCCIYCLSCFEASAVQKLLSEVSHWIKSADALKSLSFEVTSSSSCPIFDITSKAIKLCCSSTSTALRFPSVADTLTALLNRSFASYVKPLNEAQCIVNVSIQTPQSLQICLMIAPNMKHKAKRKFNHYSHNNNHFDGRKKEKDEDGLELTRSMADGLLLQFKQYSSLDCDALRDRIISYVKDVKSIDYKAMITMEAYLKPLYLLGRYCKFARDVPQSEWTINNPHDTNNDGNSNNPSRGGVRKGRNSVEEILVQAAREVFSCASAAMHACGREDIDVRMLGNGRPFVLQLLQPSLTPHYTESESIARLEALINEKRGLNCEGDISITGLARTEAEVWSSLQAVAEEKKKRYRCVVWCASPLSPSAPLSLRALSSQDEDEAGRTCLKLSQLTPLRVLHRRSLLTRIRYAYNLRIQIINAHFFVLDLTTSAGTYVKEFVHGDLGRTEPSISSMLGCACDILQLDVIRLYDDFPGGSKDDDLNL